MDTVFVSREATKPVEMLAGVVRRTMGTGEKMMLVEVELAKDAVVPLHKHIHEQVGYIVSGKVRFVIDGRANILSTGDSYAIPGNVEHEATALETSVVIDVFSPPREEYRTSYVPNES